MAGDAAVRVVDSEGRSCPDASDGAPIFGAPKSTSRSRVGDFEVATLAGAQRGHPVYLQYAQPRVAR